MKYTGSCHCQKIKFEIDAQIDKIMSCNCSICSKRGHLLTFIPEENFTLLQGEDVLQDYQFAKKIIHHYFCKICGVGPFGKGKGHNGEDMRAINIRCLDNFDYSNVEESKYDGKNL